MSDINISNTLRANLNTQLDLCRKLEDLADNLPDDVDAQSCLSLAREIYPTLKQAHEFEETILFPALRNNYSDNEQLMSTLERLRFEHWEDESFAEELRDCMISFVNERSAECINSLSYMLRGFFEGVRRHIAFEREHIIPLLENKSGSTIQDNQ
ncbi:MAG: hemerythrin domain-containing protein [Rhizobiaceae bacterium]|nr:hemerythrin domain-containing protein [Rhizobiaceae bacterium]